MSQLREIQKWFGAAISAPLQVKTEESEALRYITPSHTLRPHQRVELYQQQYWWRLLESLQENFPLLLRLRGYERFNEEIAIPYLVQHPPDHWALCRLGDSLPEWIEGRSDLDRDAAKLDAAARKAFWIKVYHHVEFSSFSSQEILEKKIALQPSIHLFELGGDLFTFRDALLQEKVSYWQDHPFPAIREGTCYFTLYRNTQNLVRWKELTREEHYLLSLFEKGTTIQAACEKIETLSWGKWDLLPLWFREWTFLKWFREFDHEMVTN